MVGTASENMTNHKIPQLILLGDSILQFSSYLPHGTAFGAGLAERKFIPFSSPIVFDHAHLRTPTLAAPCEIQADDTV